MASERRMSEFQVTEEQAKAMFASGWWRGKTDYEICLFQLFQDRLCMPFGEFHKAMQGALGRSVWTHEFAFQAQLAAEFLGEKPTPTMADIIGLIPAEKLIVVELPADTTGGSNE